MAEVAHAYQTTLRFIHDEAFSVHGAIRVSSIFTSESGEWRLGGSDLLSSMKEDDAIIYVSRQASSLIQTSVTNHAERHLLVFCLLYISMLLLKSRGLAGTQSNETPLQQPTLTTLAC